MNELQPYKTLHTNEQEYFYKIPSIKITLISRINLK